MKNRIAIITFLLSCAGLAACSLVGLDHSPPSDHVDWEGLRFTVAARITHDSIVPGLTELRAQLSAKNISNQKINRTFSACVMTLRLYQEGHWGSPAWSAPDNGSVCTAQAVSVDVNPGESASPGAWDQPVGVAQAVYTGGFAPGPGTYRVVAALRPDRGHEVASPTPVTLTAADLTLR